MKTLIMLVALTLAAPAALAGQSFQYDVLKGSLKVGRVQMKLTRQKKGLQRVRVQADVDPLGSKTLGMSIRSTTWLDRAFNPVRARWEWTSFGRERKVDARYDQGRLDGKYFKEGSLAKHMQEAREQPIGDLVSFAYWLMHQPVAPGETLKTSTYTGLQVYDLTLKAGPVEELTLPGGTHKAYRVDVEAVRPGKTRNLTVWVHAKDGALLKMSMDADMIGTVDMVLTARK